MRKVGATKVTSAAPSPVPGSDSAGGEMMRRTTSGGGTTGAPDDRKVNAIANLKQARELRLRWQVEGTLQFRRKMGA